MGRLLKILGLILGAVVVLFVLLGVLAGLLFDPNDYKEEIASAVEDFTGRSLTLEGDLELKVFPWIKIGVGPAVLSNAAGFGDEPFAVIEGAALSLKVLPLFSGQVVVGEATLTGLELNLARNARGVSNWDDLSGESVAEAAEPAASGEGLGADLDVAGIRVVDAKLSWRDAANDQNVDLSELTFEASGLSPDKSFPLSLSFVLAANPFSCSINKRASINSFIFFCVIPYLIFFL